MASSLAATASPLDAFETHQATLVREIEASVDCLAGHCRDADIIDISFHDELVLVSDTNRHKAKKLVNAVSERIEAQPAQVEQKQCVLRRFVRVLRKNSSLEEMADKLETSLTGIQERRGDSQVACTDDMSLPKNPLDELISPYHISVIGKHMRWKKWAQALDLFEGQISDIKEDNSLGYGMRGQTVLKLWKNRCEATYRALCNVALEIDEREMARSICKLVNGDWESFHPSRTVTTVFSIQSTDGVSAERVNTSLHGLNRRRRPLTTAGSEFTVAMEAPQNAHQQLLCSKEDRIAELEKQVAFLTARNEVLTDQLSGKEQELRTLTVQMRMSESRFQSQASDDQEELRDAKASNEKLGAKNKRLEEEIAKLRESLHHFQNREERLGTQLKKLNLSTDV